MPASLAAVKRRIQSTKSTRQITSAMQMVSTAKLNQIQHHTKTYQVYAEKVQAILVSLVKSHSADSLKYEQDSSLGDLFSKRPVKKTGILIITSDRGLVGSYNSNVIKSTLDKMKEDGLNADNTVFLTVGRTGAEFFKKRGMNVAYEFTGVSDVPTYREVHDVVKQAIQLYQDQVYDRLYQTEQETGSRTASDGVPLPASEYEIEPSDGGMLDMLVPQYAESLIYGAILDAKTSEHASSANAMRSASDNADDIISTLQLQYNRARQAAITTEITEITGGMTAQE